MPTPLPGTPSQLTTSGRPIMVLLDLLGRRTALRILWELRDEQLTFRALQTAAESNPGVLNARLKELREVQIVEHGGAGYGLTSQGQELLASLVPLNSWAEDWADDLNQTGL